MKTITTLTVLMFVFFFSVAQAVTLSSAQQIDIEVDAALDNFKADILGGKRFLDKAEAVLIFPRVIKAGIGIGGEYGEGALRINNRTVAYYSTKSVSVGFQLGIQSKSKVLIFLTKQALADFRKSDGWKAGIDGSVALLEWGVGEDINTIEIQDPIVGFVFGNRGLMYNLTIEGSKFTKINP